MTPRHLIGMALLAFVGLGHAQTSKPGLWEITQQMGTGASAQDQELRQQIAEAQKQMAAMPPEQRKMMEEMLAKNGVQLRSGPGGMAIKVCLTQDMVNRNEVASPPQGDCKTTLGPRTNNSQTVRFVCTNPPSSGDGVITFQGSERYHMKMTVNQGTGGPSQTMSMESQARWLGADCGPVKPLVAPK